jgi:dTDP-glucose 4,6-dehydratase
VNGILAILLNGKVGETYNIGGSNEVTNNNLVSKICGIMDKLNPKNSKHNELIEYVGDRLGHDWRYSLDTEKIREELGWSHATNFDKQLYNTVVWYLGHLGN